MELASRQVVHIENWHNLADGIQMIGANVEGK